MGVRDGKPCMGGWVVIFLLILLPGVGLGQAFEEGAFSARSVSGQFAVQGLRSGSISYKLLPLATNLNYVCLEPNLVAVSCERIRQLVARELGVPDVWRGKVYVVLRAATGSGDQVSVTSTHFADGWRYRLEMPDLVHRRDYMQGVIQTLLLEYANRQAGDRSAEVPAWLVEGLTEQMLNSGEMGIILPPPRWTKNYSPPSEFLTVKRSNPLAAAHKVLKSAAPLTFQELSWPTDEMLRGASAGAYRANAQLLLTSLIQLREGRASLRVMLERLPRFYNWQLAFLEAFNGYFLRTLDVEKWWALRSVQFSTRDLAQIWGIRESSEQLASTLRVPVRVYESTNALPEYSEVTLQKVVSTWQVEEQQQALQSRLRGLELLESRLAPEIVPIAQNYRGTILNYLQDHLKGQEPRRTPIGRSVLKQIARDMAARLDALDQRLKSATPRS